MRIGAAALAVAAALGAGEARGQEDIQYSLSRNSGFEEGEAGWKFGQGWGPLPDAEKGKHVEVRTDKPKAGRQYLRVRNDKKSFISVNSAERIRFQAGQSYKVSWWSRGWASSVGHEQGSNRLHISDAGGPEYTGDFPYKSEDWTYHEHSFTAARTAEGQVSFWIWGDGHCDIDNFMVRKSFWTTDRDRNAAHPGEVVRITFDMAGREPAAAAVSYRITAPDGREVKSGKIEGRTPLRKELEFSSGTPGCYTLTSEAKTSGGAFQDTLTLCIKAPKGGLDGVKSFWENQGK